MAAAFENFTTTTHDAFIWPYPVPLIAKPAQPPMNTGLRVFTPRIDPEDCPCDVHSYEKSKNRYKYLADKERQIVDQLVKVNREMTNLATAMLDSNCESMDETMKSVYKTDYSKRGLPIQVYRQLKAAVDSPYCSPIKTETLEIKRGYRDPNRFRYSAIERPHIQPAKTINLFEVPETFSLWEEPFTSRSEYTVTISKMGLSNMKNRQQYLEPIPSSRRRFGDCKLDRFSERIEDGEIDPRVASIPSKLDGAAEQLIHKHILDHQRTVYQVSYKNHWVRKKRSREEQSDEETEVKEKDIQNELLAYIRELYFNPHNEKVLAPPVTAKRMLGYIRPKLLHATHSTYQDTFGRTGARVMLENNDQMTLGKVETTDTVKKNDPCVEFNTNSNRN
ncbi:hypothetical protein WN55_08335 [Dufourea novaeangliae]|uniref:Uncharacterized protein n=1 Tax=Dufourea novaeangliae TaxID=178035 RepID=A0A154P897_DUFNO|nr:hypothetical protein WN55_08335 [Dufourea novaeangliae]